MTSDDLTHAVPEPVARIAELMSTFGRPWCLCGGWAVDAWLGRQTREHGDQDIAVFQDDQRGLFEHLRGWQLVAHDPDVDDDTSEVWDGVRHLGLPAHIHARSPEVIGDLPARLDAAAKQGFGLDIQLAARSGDDWVISRNPLITLPLQRSVQQSVWGLPTLVPEVLLFFKAQDIRPRDERDLAALLVKLGPGRRSWLTEAISTASPGHPWLAELSH